jgi:hypothetical protein
VFRIPRPSSALSGERIVEIPAAVQDARETAHHDHVLAQDVEEQLANLGVAVKKRCGPMS